MYFQSLTPTSNFRGSQIFEAICQIFDGGHKIFDTERQFFQLLMLNIDFFGIDIFLQNFDGRHKKLTNKILMSDVKI